MTDEPFGFAGRAAVVSGCGSGEGIGFACARLLAQLGARVAITSTTDRIEARAETLLGEGATVFADTADLADRKQAFAFVDAARAAIGPLDVLVNAAGMVQTGIAPVGASFLELSSEDLERELEITFKTAFHLTQGVLPGWSSAATAGS